MVFEELLDEYLSEENNNGNNVQAGPKPSTRQLNSTDESELIKEFLKTPCSCGKPCKESLNFDEIKKSRREFSTLSWVEKNAFMLSQLNLLTRDPENARSARQTKSESKAKV